MPELRAYLLVGFGERHISGDGKALNVRYGS